ncbi:hypothetical protein Scep_013951 [Stephania cephalantha]|uniref:Uncharacterized protein n=1 Tax=Stephania cephalantha TaxID=152367 RepID=A0AAP0J148_9MAGN
MCHLYIKASYNNLYHLLLITILLDQDRSCHARSTLIRITKIHHQDTQMKMMTIRKDAASSSSVRLRKATEGSSRDVSLLCVAAGFVKHVSK